MVRAWNWWEVIPQRENPLEPVKEKKTIAQIGRSSCRDSHYRTWGAMFVVSAVSFTIDCGRGVKVPVETVE